jgi:hypothetical protein
MANKLYLSKTLFSKVNSFTGCQRKLFYELNGYPKLTEFNESLQFYADNGKAIGALAKGYYPQGIEIYEKDPEKAYQATLELLNKHPSVVLFEAAFIYNGCYVRVDVLIKEKNTLKLIEVKSKHVKVDQQGQPTTGSKPLVMDLTFQYYVVSQALGKDYTIHPYFYQIKRDYQAALTYRGFFKVEEGVTHLNHPLAQAYLDSPLLEMKDANQMVQQTLTQGFKDHVNGLVKAMRTNKKLDPGNLGSKCKGCEFKVAMDQKKHGYKECWQLPQYAGLKDEAFHQPGIFDIGFGISIKKLIEEGRYRLEDAQSFLEDKPKQNQKQLLQVKKLINQDASIEIDRQGLQKELSQLVYPLYFLDFEAFPSALPMFPYYRPNQKVIFQYSIHKIDQVGEKEVIAHAAQFIDLGSEDPTLKLIRSLQNDLGSQGSVFMYSPYENTCLNNFEDWLNAHPEVEDKLTLMKFIHSLTYRKEGNRFIRKPGHRVMIDLCDWVNLYYLDPATKGSNSIKKILPSVIQQSTFLQQKYGQKDLYGRNLTIKSLNFDNQTWIVKQGQSYLNPYDLLGNPLGLTQQKLEELEELNDSSIEIKNGAMAIIAYSFVQNNNLTLQEVNTYRNALLRYCELDTLAMVMVFEALMHNSK